MKNAMSVAAMAAVALLAAGCSRTDDPPMPNAAMQSVPSPNPPGAMSTPTLPPGALPDPVVPSEPSVAERATAQATDGPGAAKDTQQPNK